MLFRQGEVAGAARDGIRLPAGRCDAVCFCCVAFAGSPVALHKKYRGHRREGNRPAVAVAGFFKNLCGLQGVVERTVEHNAFVVNIDQLVEAGCYGFSVARLSSDGQRAVGIGQGPIKVAFSEEAGAEVIRRGGDQGAVFESDGHVKCLAAVLLCPGHIHIAEVEAQIAQRGNALASLQCRQQALE